MVVLRVLRLLCGKGVFCSSVSVGLPIRFWLKRQETELQNKSTAISTAQAHLLLVQLWLLGELTT